ncbi:MAG: hypothetical protein JSS91_13955 [Bacteroidetes bacterium]|nr:hypothetical protein [Bacteroidota bacterium]
MIPGFPLYADLLFILTALLTAVFLYSASERSTAAAIAVLIILAAETLLSLCGFYRSGGSFPPRFIFLALPAVIFMISLFFFNGGRQFIDSLDEEILTYLHIVRIPVEISLYILFIYKMVPEIMTFGGRNFDILSGITAPIIAYFGYRKKMIGKKVILIWNFISLGLLFNVVITAVLSVPSGIQQFGFDQPNTGVLYFPFVWLPGFIVPTVLFSHIVCIKKLLIK